MGRTERAPKGTAGLQGVQGGLSPEWSTRGKELMPTERCQTLPCAAARARSGVGKSLLIRRGKTNAPQRPSENHRASQGWGLSTAPPMAAPAYKQGQPPNPGGMQREGPAELRGPPRTPNANSSEFCGTFPSPSSGPTWDLGGCCPTPTPVWGPRPAGMGTDCYGDAAQGHTALPPHSAPAQRSTHTAPGSGAAHPHPKPIGCRGGAVRKAPQLQLPQWHRGADGSHGVGRSTWIFPPPPPVPQFPPRPPTVLTTPPPAAPEGAADPTQPPYGWGPPRPWQRALPIQRSLRPNDPKRSTGGGTQTPKLRAAPRSGSGAAVPLPYLLAPQSAASQTLLQPRRAALRAGHQHGAATGTPRGRLRSAHSHNAALRGRFWGRGAFWGRSSFWGRRTRSALS